MFTGIITEMGEVVSLDKEAGGARLAVAGRRVFLDAAIGDSIAINGVCLTVVALAGNTASFDVSQETLRSTNLGDLGRGFRVNLEPSLKPETKMGGHFVTGHVECSGRVMTRNREGNAERYIIGAEESILRYVVPKGSISVDGISLTVVDVFTGGFSLVIIPHTAAVTTLSIRKAGDRVNLEPDILAKYVEKLLGSRFGKNDAHTRHGGDEVRFLDALRKSGFTG